MPSIKKDSQQVQALKDIEEALNTIGNINSIIDADPTGKDLEFQITLAQESGRGIKVSLGKQEGPKIISTLSQTRQRLAKEVQKTADKYRIELDDEDKATLGLESGSQE